MISTTGELGDLHQLLVPPRSRRLVREDRAGGPSSPPGGLWPRGPPEGEPGCPQRPALQGFKLQNLSVALPQRCAQQPRPAPAGLRGPSLPGYPCCPSPHCRPSWCDPGGKEDLRLGLWAGVAGWARSGWSRTDSGTRDRGGNPLAGATRPWAVWGQGTCPSSTQRPSRAHGRPGPPPAGKWQAPRRAGPRRPSGCACSLRAPPLHAIRSVVAAAPRPTPAKRTAFGEEPQGKGGLCASQLIAAVEAPRQQEQNPRNQSGGAPQEQGVDEGTPRSRLGRQAAASCGWEGPLGSGSRDPCSRHLNREVCFPGDWGWPRGISGFPCTDTGSTGM